MNQKQKRSLWGAVIIIAASLIVWIAYGGHIITRTQVLIEKKDELFPDMVQKEWVDKFIWGLDLSLVLSATTIFVGGLLFYLLRDKKRSTELS